MHYKISIVDDSSADTQYVSALAARWAESAGHTVNICSFPSAEAFLFQCEETQDFDILLLDIEMGAMNGVDLAKKIRCRNDAVQIVFITGYPDFIAEGYEVAALHYLMKPVSYEKLHAVLDCAAANLGKTEKRLCVTYDRSTDLVPLSQILYVEAQKQYVLIHTPDKTYRMKRSFAETVAELDEFFSSASVHSVSTCATSRGSRTTACCWETARRSRSAVGSRKRSAGRSSDYFKEMQE